MRPRKHIPTGLLLASITCALAARTGGASDEASALPGSSGPPVTVQGGSQRRAWPADPDALDAEGVERPNTLFTVQEAGVLRPGLVEVTFLVDNYDRDPLGLDVVDGSIGLRIGLPKRLELGLSYQITRAVSSPGWLPVPAPPLDIVVMQGEMASGPYRSMYWPMPFLHHSPARVDAMVPGEYSLGIKGRLFGQSGLRPALALGVGITAPGDQSLAALAKGSGSGSADFGLTTVVTWRYRRLFASGNLGVLLNGDVDPADRLIDVPSGRTTDLAIRRPHFLRSGLALRYRIWRDVSAVGELSGWTTFGAHTALLDGNGAVDALAGLQIRHRSVTLALGVREHLNPQQNALNLPIGPLAGAVDLSDLPAEQRSAVLAWQGVRGHRPDANAVVLGWPEDVPLPEGARIVPDHYTTSTTGNVGFVVRISLRLGQ